MANEATIILGALNMAEMNMNDASDVPSPVTSNEPQRVFIDSRLIILHPDFSFAELEGTLPNDLALNDNLLQLLFLIE